MHRHAMVKAGDTVAVAVSGGRDSCAMLAALQSLKTKLGFEIIVAHFDHQLRGEASAEDARFVQRLAQRWDLPFVGQACEVRSLAKRQKLSLEAAARKARYDFLESTALARGASVIAVAHTLEDRAETFFLHLFRGAGPEGLTSMRPVRALDSSVRVVRPLLECTHEEVETYNREQRIEPRTDESNEDTRYLRNRVRKILLPLVRSEFCPRVDSAIGRLMEVWQTESEFLEQETSSAFRMLLQEDDGVRPVERLQITVDRTRFQKCPRALQRRILRRAYEAIHGNSQDLNFQHTENLLDWMQSGTAQGYWTLPAGMRVDVELANFCLYDSAHEPAGHEELIALQVPGRTTSDLWGLSLEARIFDWRDEGFPVDPDVAWIDRDRTGRMYLRNPRPGDRFHPLGCRGTQKLQDYFVNMKIPRSRRGRVPLVLSEGEIVWILGHRLDDRFKVTDQTKTVLELRVLRQREFSPRGKEVIV